MPSTLLTLLGFRKVSLIWDRKAFLKHGLFGTGGSNML